MLWKVGTRGFRLSVPATATAKGAYSCVQAVPVSLPPLELAGADRTSLARRKSDQRTNGPRCAVGWTGRTERGVSWRGNVGAWLLEELLTAPGISLVGELPGYRLEIGHPGFYFLVHVASSID